MRPRIIVSHEDRLIWIAVEKVASMQMHAAMTRMLGIDFNQWERCSIDSIEQVARMDGYFRFAFVRNPWARLFSCYMDKIVGPSIREHQPFILERFGFSPGIPFERFVQGVAGIDDAEADDHFRGQFYTLSWQGELVVDYVGRFENLPRDWDIVRDSHGLPELPFAPVNTNRPRFDFDYHKPHYTPELIEIVAERYADDIRHFGYEY